MCDVLCHTNLALFINSQLSTLFLTPLHLKHSPVQPNWTIPCSLNITLISCQSSFIHASINFPKTCISKFRHLSSPVSDVTSSMQWTKVFSISSPNHPEKMSPFFEISQICMVISQISGSQSWLLWWGLVISWFWLVCWIMGVFSSWTFIKLYTYMHSSKCIYYTSIWSI